MAAACGTISPASRFDVTRTARPEDEANRGRAPCSTAAAASASRVMPHTFTITCRRPEAAPAPHQDRRRSSKRSPIRNAPYPGAESRARSADVLVRFADGDDALRHHRDERLRRVNVHHQRSQVAVADADDACPGIDGDRQLVRVVHFNQRVKSEVGRRPRQVRQFPASVPRR